VRTYPFTEDRKALWERQGRGTGDRETWNPWLHRGDFSSRGIVTIDSLYGDNGREIQLFSVPERNGWKVYSSSQDTETVQEQVPHDRDLSRRIAREMGIPHPRDPESQVDIVVTTDLVVTQRRLGGEHRKIARSVKPEHEMNSPNQAEHAELEKRLCAYEGITDFKFLFESSFPQQLLQNIDLLYMNRDLHKQLEPLGYEGSFAYVSAEVCEHILHANTDATLANFCLALNQQSKWPPGLATRTALHAIRWHKLKADLVGSPILSQPVRAIANASRGPNVRQFKPGAA
jgi:hypothetical protein